jgi:hypothetical protein
LGLKFKDNKAYYYSVQNILSPRLLSKNLGIKMCKTIILLAVLYRCENWSLTLRKEHRLKIFEKRMLKRISGPKRDEMIEGWRKPHNEESQNLHSSPNIIRKMRSRGMKCAGHVASMGRRGMNITFWWINQKERDH